jgi:RNA polymerase subunit RPABC4/transcription elongation factor Spt4
MTCMDLPANITAIISYVLLVLGAYATLFMIGLVVWTFRDIRTRSRDLLVQILATLLVLVFNLPGLLIYYILRPQQTLATAYERSLSQEALLQDIEERYICPSCRRKVEADFLLCPHCHTELRRRCPHCEHLMNLNWNTCPYCGQPEIPTPEEDDKDLPD